VKLKEVYIIGAGTYGEVMHDLCELLHYKVIGYYDDNEQKLGCVINGVRVLGKLSDLSEKIIEDKLFIVAIGNNVLRHSIMSDLKEKGALFPSIIHPTAFISETAKLGVGCYVQANAVIWAYTEIGDYTIISPNAVIAHHTIIGQACLISTLSGIGASIHLEDRVFVGMGSTIVTGVKRVCADTYFGAGTVLLKSVEVPGVYVGAPARRIKSVEDKNENKSKHY